MVKDKKKVLICIDWFLPAYKAGGPIQSIANLVNHTKSHFDYYIVTSNSDLDETLDLPILSLNKWINKEDYRIIYLDAQHQTYKFYKELFYKEQFDAVYFNSLFSQKFTLLPLLVCKNLPIRKVLAPRGMLGKGALAIKPLKKKVFLKLFKALGFHKKVVWHVTAESEKLEVLKNFGASSNSLLAPNLSAKTLQTLHPKEKEVNKLNIFFLSRIAVKKNLGEAIDYLANVKDSYLVNFSIIGPIEEPNYWDICKVKIDQLPKHIEVNYLGAVPHHEIANHLVDKHILLLPTQHENFGHVIMESWQNGCPVVISDQTPWQSLSNEKLGFEIPLHNKSQFIAKIELFCAMNSDEFNEWFKASVEFAKKFTENPNLIEQNKALFLNTLNN
ncbi:glycosyltransferase [Winogradskyella endarachnes]|uniref:Glycosyltransferase n=1 Tax=Winogradskyella endarachnes TaxID=2681965 RepID=A0A6L6U6S7_9FLAO|nr:glycosyltransferase [Winogradskyella endarachnes]MUU77878.1 glycosyltransferase [Winogradskyella endarachnes]